MLHSTESLAQQYRQLQETATRQLADLLVQHVQPVKQISVQAKSIEKLVAKYRKYQLPVADSLSAATDVISFQITVYEQTEVAEVACLIESHFTVDRVRSVDLRDLSKSTFGTQVPRYVVQLPQPESGSEDEFSHRTKFEIHICTVFLESISSLAQKLDSQASSPKSDDESGNSTEPLQELTGDNLLVFIRSSALLTDIIKQAAETYRYNTEVVPEARLRYYIDKVYLPELSRHGVATLGCLSRLLEANRKAVVRYCAVIENIKLSVQGWPIWALMRILTENQNNAQPH